MIFLVQYGDHTEEVHLREGSSIVGRDEMHCRVLLPCRGVEPIHAKCFYDPANEKVVISQLRGTIRVNGERVEKADLRPFDVLQVGDATLTLMAGHTSRAPRPKPPPDEPRSARGVSFDEAEDYTQPPASSRGSELITVPDTDRNLVRAPETRRTELLFRDGRWFLRDLTTQKEVEIILLGDRVPAFADRSGQPRVVDLISQEGRWFLRDPETRSEAEIARVEDIQPAATSSLAATRRIPVRGILLAAAVAGVALTIFAITRIIPASQVQPSPIPFAAFSEQIQRGFARFERDDFREARARFEEAHKLIPGFSLAKVLLELTAIEESRGPDYQNYPWSSAKELYQNLTDDSETPREIRELARARLSFIGTYQLSRNSLEDARRSFAQGEVMATLQKTRREIPAESPLRKQEAEWFRELHRKAAAEFVSRAQAALAERRWTEAIHAATEAQTTDPLSDGRKLIETCRRSQEAQTVIEKARKLVEESAARKDDPARAKQALQEALQTLQAAERRVLFAETPLADEARQLDESIRQRIGTAAAEDKAARFERLFLSLRGPEAIETLRRDSKDIASLPVEQRFRIWAAAQTFFEHLFQKGRAEEAIRLLDQGADVFDPALLDLKPKIRAVLDLSQEASRLDEQKSYAEAKGAWTRLRDQIGDEANVYRQKAMERLAWYAAEGVKLSESLRRDALLATKDDPAKARKLIDQALEWNPENAEAKKESERMDKEAQMQFQLGYALTKSDPEKARQHLERAIQYASETSDIAIKAKLALSKLQK